MPSSTRSRRCCATAARAPGTWAARPVRSMSARRWPRRSAAPDGRRAMPGRRGAQAAFPSPGVPVPRPLNRTAAVVRVARGCERFSTGSQPEGTGMGQATIPVSTIVRRCERVVVTAYRELRVTGNDDLSAFRACTTLYRVHHPEASVQEARRLVAEWIDHHVVRGDPGPTDGCECD